MRLEETFIASILGCYRAWLIVTSGAQKVCISNAFLPPPDHIPTFTTDYTNFLRPANFMPGIFEISDIFWFSSEKL